MKLTDTADFTVLADSRTVPYIADIAPVSYMHSKYEDEINDLKRQLAEANKRIDTLEQIILQHYTSLTDYK
jgi:hypothetical protein